MGSVKCFPLPARTNKFLVTSVQVGSGVYPASSPVGKWDVTQRLIPAERGTNPHSPRNPVPNLWIRETTPPFDDTSSWKHAVTKHRSSSTSAVSWNSPSASDVTSQLPVLLFPRPARQITDYVIWTRCQHLHRFVVIPASNSVWNSSLLRSAQCYKLDAWRAGAEKHTSHSLSHVGVKSKQESSWKKYDSVLEDGTYLYF
jgi:hypothetical protein